MTERLDRTRRPGRNACTPAAPGSRGVAASAALAVLALLAAQPAFGHAGERGFILLLPTGLFQAAGTIAVAVSFLVVIRFRGAALRRAVEAARWRLFRVPRRVPGSNAVASAALVALVAAGLAGSRDPLANPLPLSVWTLLWVGLTFIHAVLGNVWPLVNPWTAFARLVRRVLGRRDDDDSGLLSWPDALGGWPAVALLLVFAWFELVFPAPRDPAILAYAVVGYSFLTVAGMVLFGDAAWTRHAEIFSRFFRIVSWIAPFRTVPDEEGEHTPAPTSGAGAEHGAASPDDPALAPTPGTGGDRGAASPDEPVLAPTAGAGGPRGAASPANPVLAPTPGTGGGRVAASPVGYVLVATLPGARLLGIGSMPAAGVVFVVVALATVSFDGLSRTFWWLGLLGENPLEHPGRTTLVGRNTLGLIGAAAALLAAYAVSAAAGAWWSGAKAAPALRRFVVSIVPIAFGYHFAHYLPSFLVDAQYALKALSDPFALGWNLLGMRDFHVTASFLTHHASVEAIWYAQVGVIVAAHVAAVVALHGLVGESREGRLASILSEIPLTVLMIGYTVFGLWLLSTPVAA